MNNLMLISAVEPLALQGNVKLAVAIIFGIFLGMLLVKCDFADRQQVKANLTFASMKMAKTLLLALSVGMVVFVLLRQVHVVQAHLPPATIWGVLLGGAAAGVGLGLGGLVPVTAVAALASGRLYAIWVIIGMLLAFPAAQFCRDTLGSAVSRFAVPVSVSMEPGNGIFASDSPVLWVSAIALLLCLILHFCGSKESK